MGFESRPHPPKQGAALVGVVNLAQPLKQMPSSHLSSAIGLAEIGNEIGNAMREHMALNQLPVIWGPRSLQMVRRRPKMVSQ